MDLREDFRFEVRGLEVGVSVGVGGGGTCSSSRLASAEIAACHCAVEFDGGGGDERAKCALYMMELIRVLCSIRAFWLVKIRFILESNTFLGSVPLKKVFNKKV